LAGSEDSVRVEAQNLISQMIEEALESFHRRLIVLFGEGSSDVLVFLILKYRALKMLLGGDVESIVYVDYYEGGGEALKSLVGSLEGLGFPIESIRHHTYEESNRLLGTTNDILVMDMSRGVRPNDIGRLVETVRGGGLIVLYNLRLEVDKPWETSIHKSLVHPPYSWGDLKARFERYFVRKLMEAPGVWIMDGWRILKGELLHPPKAPARRLEMPEETGVPKRLYRLALTEEQAKALELVERLMRGRERNVLLVTSNRGRGKSALLGLSAAMLLHFGIGRIIITAPSGEENQIIVDMIERGLSALNDRFVREQRDGSCRIKCKRGVVEFIPPQKALKESADMLMVDEAAGIPVPLLFALAERFPKIIFASTIHGYEGAGRGFSLRFLKALRESKGINLFKVELKEPIRYAPNDPIENWLYDALLLDAEPVDVDAIRLGEIRPEDIIYEKVDLDRWFELEEKRLREFIGIYVLAHYRNRPDDLVILGDAPHHFARAVSIRSGEIIGALHVAEEGRMPDEVIDMVLAGNAPSGNLIPSCIVKYYPPFRDFAHLRGLRIVRIAVHPELMGRGIGSLALKNLCEEAVEGGFDWVGASFGADRALLNFWLKNGFIPVHLSPMRNIVSGEYSVAVVKPLSDRATSTIRDLYMEFKMRLLNALPDTYFSLEPDVAAQLLSIDRWDHLERPSLTPSQRDRLISYVKESLAYEGACDAIRQILLAHFMSSGRPRASMEPRAEVALIARCLQCRSWDRTANSVGMKSAELKTSMRSYVGRLMEHYGIS